MAISSGHGLIKGIERMEEPHQFFHIGEPFLYTPLSDPGRSMIIEAVKVDLKETYDFNICQDMCCLYEFCMRPGNYTQSGSNWIPVCLSTERTDDTRVVFKKVV